jgi:hypothetical protein
VHGCRKCGEGVERGCREGVEGVGSVELERVWRGSGVSVERVESVESVESVEGAEV